LAQAFFCLTVTLALVTSAGWTAAQARGVSPRLARLAAFTTGLVFVQLVLGALMRHMGAGLAIPDFPLAFGRLLPPLATPYITVHFAHRVGALAVAAAVAMTVGAVLRERAAGPSLRRPALLAAGLVLVQLTLGALALNQYMERDLDARMERTRHRPLPEGRLHAAEALGVGLVLLATGLLFLAGTTNAVATLVTAGIAATYLLLYTPLKPVTSLCSLVGAVPGALPPVAGWAAARGTLGAEAWILFAIMFLWQIPHSLAIGRMYRDDYARAGIRVLPVVDRDGASTGV